MFVGYTSTKGYGLIDRELYMPERWFTDEYAERREKCQVPESLIFKTKNQIGLELIRKALDTGLFPVGWVGFDAGFSNDSKFRDAVDSLQVNYLGDIKSNTLVWLNRPKVEYRPTAGKGVGLRKSESLKVKSQRYMFLILLMILSLGGIPRFWLKEHKVRLSLSCAF